MHWLRNLFARRRRYEDISVSIREHFEEKIEELMADGLTREEAMRRARLEFGDTTLVEERSREQWLSPTFDSLWADVRFAWRQIAKSPGFVLTVCLTLAVGIGANTAIFSVVNALLLRQLPYAHPERLGTIYVGYTHGAADASERHHLAIDGEEWEMLRDRVPSLLSAVSGSDSGVNLDTGSHAEYLHAGRVSAHYFEVLGIQPLLGRGFSEQEDRPGGPKVALLSYELWQTIFGGNPQVVGQGIRLKGTSYTVIGVLPQGSTTPLNTDLYTPLAPSRDGEGGGTNYMPVFRLREGADWQRADAEISRAWYDTAHARGRRKENPGAAVSYFCVALQKSETDELRPQALVLMLAAGFILLIACANLAGLTLVRVLRRSNEIVTRMALGASRWRIQRALWIENLLLALLGGAAGVAVGFVALRGLLALLPERFLPVASVPLDGRVLGFTLGLALMTSVLFGMLPTLSTRRFDLRPSDMSRAGMSAGGLRLRQGLIAGEIALTVLLLAASGLLIRTLVHLETLPPGFNPEGVMTAKASLDDARYNDPAAFRQLLDESLAAMRGIPGVQSVGVGLTLPYERPLNAGVRLDSRANGLSMMTNEVYVTPGYFETLQISLIAGRVFTQSDGPEAQPVVIVNQNFVQRYFSGQNPVGRVLYEGMQQGKGMLIVGVAADTVASSAGGLHDNDAPLANEETIYIPAAQMTGAQKLALVHTWFQPSWIVRTAGPVDGLTGQMQRAMASVAPGLPFSGFYAMHDLMAETLAMQRVEVALLTVMALLALLLSAVGIFALVSNMVVQRTREIGIRIALGSSLRAAMVHVGRAGTSAAVLGLVLGLGLCLGLLRVLRSELYGVSVYDAPTLAGVVLTLFLIALLASAIPAFRVAGIDPATTLREE